MQVLGAAAYKGAQLAAPFLIEKTANAACTWTRNALDTWGPAWVANRTVDKCANTGQSYAGTAGWFIGKAIGVILAPGVAQGEGTKMALNVAKTAAGVAVPIIVEKGASWAAKKMFGEEVEVTAKQEEAYAQEKERREEVEETFEINVKHATKTSRTKRVKRAAAKKAKKAKKVALKATESVAKTTPSKKAVKKELQKLGFVFLPKA
ncbi:MAG: hypothetical protein H7A37_04540 [Chlamydiales bacterium]|nr:hypothetical protein [Chlamydiia bacterium]MCP5507551.1 hypothetical protein [Chlamydiales bacterium]